MLSTFLFLPMAHFFKHSDMDITVTVDSANRPTDTTVPSKVGLCYCNYRDEIAVRKKPLKSFTNSAEPIGISN